MSAVSSRSQGSVQPGDSGACHVSVKVQALPEGTSLDDGVYISGSFNGWNAKDEACRLARDDHGAYSVTIPARVGAVLEYKFTRGSWDSVETAPNVETIENRRTIVEADGQEITATIRAWRDGIDDLTGRVGIAGTIEVIRAFYVPQLGVFRRVWVYLPHDYHTSDRRYPVIYMHDGRDLFDAATSFSSVRTVDDGGSSKLVTSAPAHPTQPLDETMESRCAARALHGAIIVAPDNGGAKRANEFSPWWDQQEGVGGQGDKYVDFLVQTLKPYIDVRFRTLRERQYTGIVGSAMGGLISLYAALKYPEIFARVGAFSSSFWFAGRRIFDVVRARGKGGQLQRAGRLQVYLYVGAREAGRADRALTEVEDTVEMFRLLQKIGLSADDLELKVDERGDRSEVTWTEMFGAAYLRLFGDG